MAMPLPYDMEPRCRSRMYEMWKTQTKVNGMGKKEWVDKNHYRVTSDDGRTSWLYETDGWFSYCVEVAEHHPDGTTDAYEADNSVIGQLFHGGKGKHK